MPKWTIVDKVYLYDGSIEGLFTIVYDAILKKELPQNITTEEKYEATIFSDPIFIKTDFKKSEKVFVDIVKEISKRSLFYTYNAFKSYEKIKEIEIVKYLIYGFKYGGKINAMKNIRCVYEVQRMSYSVGGEAHKLSGFVRFRELANGILYSEISPKNDVVDILSNHFLERLSNEIWVIHDRGRNKAAIYHRNKYIIADVPEILKDNLHLAEKEEEYQILWKDFCTNIAIKERRNRRCQMNFMPKRYWKYMLEMGDEL